MRKITIADRTLAQKQNTAEDALSFKEKVAVARLLESAKADAVEFPPIANEKTDPLLLRTVCAFLKNSILSLEVGLTEESIELSFEAIRDAEKPRLLVALPVSPVQMEYVCHKKAPKMAAMIETFVSKCASLCPDVEFCALDATRAEPEFLKTAIETAISSGAKTVTVCDDEAVMLPDAFALFIEDLKKNIPVLDSVTLGVRCADTFGMAEASVMLAAEKGAGEIKCACGTNTLASLDTLSHIFRNTGDRLGLFTGLQYTELSRIAGQIAKITDTKRSENSPFDSGVAASSPTEISLTSDDTLPTVIAAVKKLGYDLSEEDCAKVYESFQRVAEKKTVSVKELDAIVASSALQVPPAYTLISYVINTGNIITSSANITLSKDGEEKSAICLGDGPIDAAFLTIEQIVGHHYELDDFQIQAVTEGREAMGSALVKLRENGKLYSGNGISTDILGASIEAYISALNKISFEEN